MARYFTEETDRSIEKFLDSTDIAEKHRIFDGEIRPAFQKLIENQIFVYRFFSLDDVETLKMECLTNLYETLPKYDRAKSTKGFSYFNQVAKNWFIHKYRERSKKNKLESDLYHDLDHEKMKNDPSLRDASREDEILEKEFWVSLHQNMDVWRAKLTKQSEKQVLEAVIFLLQNPDDVPSYNKKAIYIYLRELTGLNTKQVVVHLKKLKTYYLKFREQFHLAED